MEVQSEAARAVDAGLTQRLIALELTDVDVPPPRDVDSDVHSVYFRVLATWPASLVVELWELGVLHGSRTVSALGSPRLRARRVALAAAELARQLRQRRLLEARLTAEQPLEPSLPDTPERGSSLRARFGVEAGGSAAAVGLHQLWLAGPYLAGVLRFERGPRIALGGRFLAGTLADVSRAPSVRWMELAIAPSYTIQAGPAFGLDMGLTAAASALHLGEVIGVDGQTGQYDTWSARASAHLRFEPRLARKAWLSFGPDVGVVLRRLEIEAESGESVRLGGLWLGFNASVLIDPSAP